MSRITAFALVSCAAALTAPSLTRRGALADLGRAAAAAAIATAPPSVARADGGGDGLAADGLAVAYFSGGDARFLQKAFDDIAYKGVVETTVGALADGTRAVRVRYKPARLTYKRLLGSYWRAVDPTKTAEQGQFGDRGPEFRTVVWPADAAERASALESMRRLDASGLFKRAGPWSPTIVTEVETLGARGAGFEPGPPADQKWYQTDAAAAARRKTGRDAWFSKAYDPVTTTACEGSVCGYVYFPCSAENGCLAVMNGDF